MEGSMVGGQGEEEGRERKSWREEKMTKDHFEVEKVYRKVLGVLGKH